jgi:hypothetical protein
MKIKDKFFFSHTPGSTYEIYYIDEADEKVYYLNQNWCSYCCPFDIFKEHAITITPLLEELL